MPLSKQAGVRADLNISSHHLPSLQNLSDTETGKLSVTFKDWPFGALRKLLVPSVSFYLHFFNLFPSVLFPSPAKKIPVSKDDISWAAVNSYTKSANSSQYTLLHPCALLGELVAGTCPVPMFSPAGCCGHPCCPFRPELSSGLPSSSH